ncbi:MAG: VWA domain-containing protein [Myxococcota bacterium]
MRFAEPLGILWALLAPLIIFMEAWLERRRTAALGQAGDLGLITEMTGLGEDRGRRTRRIEAYLIAAAMVLLSIAMARPQFGARTELSKARGMDIVIALDLSRSMLAQDVAPSRLERAKIELLSFAKELRGDRVGLVGFTSVALPLCPLTVDKSALGIQLRSAGPDALPRGGTAIADAIRVSKEMLDRSPYKDSGKAIVVVTDGEEHEGDPEAAAKEAKEAGIDVHVVGVGSAAGEPIPLPEGGYLKDLSGQTVISRLDEGMLQKIADAGSGLAALPGPSGGFDLGPVRGRLAQMEKAELETRTIRVYEERYRWFLVPALALLAIASLVRPRRRTEMLPAAGLLLLLLSPSLSASADPLEREHPDVKEGNALLQSGKAKEALEAYERAQKSLGQDPRVVLDQGLAQAAAGELDKAIDAYKSALAAGQDKGLRSQAAYAMGNAYRAMKKYDEAVTSYRRALVEDPSFSAARKNLELTSAMKRIAPLQPHPPNKDGDKKQPPNDQDGGASDGGGQDGGSSGDSGSQGQDGGGNEGQDGGGEGQDSGGQGGAQDAGNSPDGGSGSGAQDGGGGADGGSEDGGAGASGQQQDSAEKPDEKRAQQILDALEAREKAVQNQAKKKKVTPRRVEKDW